MRIGVDLAIEENIKQILEILEENNRKLFKLETVYKSNEKLQKCLFMSEKENQLLKKQLNLERSHAKIHK